MGSIKKKMGLKGKTKPGEMISRMNAMKMTAGSASGVGRLQKAKIESSKVDKKMDKAKGIKEGSKADKKMDTKLAKGGLKKSGTFQGKSNKLGGGGRFAQMVSKLKGKVSNPKAVAASIGRKSLGKAKFQKLATKGRKNG